MRLGLLQSRPIACKGLWLFLRTLLLMAHQQQRKRGYQHDSV